MTSTLRSLLWVLGVHQALVLSSLLFIIVIKALSRKSRTGTLWELLYPDDVVIIADSLEEIISELLAWKRGMESKGLRVNMRKTKKVHGVWSTFGCTERLCQVPLCSMLEGLYFRVLHSP